MTPKKEEVTNRIKEILANPTPDFLKAKQAAAYRKDGSFLTPRKLYFERLQSDVKEED